MIKSYPPNSKILSTLFNKPSLTIFLLGTAFFVENTNSFLLSPPTTILLLFWMPLGLLFAFIIKSFPFQSITKLNHRNWNRNTPSLYIKEVLTIVNKTPYEKTSRLQP